MTEKLKIFLLSIKIHQLLFCLDRLQQRVNDLQLLSVLVDYFRFYVSFVFRNEKLKEIFFIFLDNKMKAIS